MNDQAMPEPVLAQTLHWFEQVVLGLRLCPFAAMPYHAGRLRTTVTWACTESDLLAALEDELCHLARTDPERCETSLLIHPNVLQDFVEYNQFLDLADALIDSLELAGVIQVASFHPDYCFAGSEPADRANLSNRSPYPTLHLLREKSIADAVDAGADSDQIVSRNIDLLRSMPDDQLCRYFGERSFNPES